MFTAIPCTGVIKLINKREGEVEESLAILAHYGDPSQFIVKRGDIDLVHMQQLFSAFIINSKINQFTKHGAALASEYIIHDIYSQYTRD